MVSFTPCFSKVASIFAATASSGDAGLAAGVESFRLAMRNDLKRRMHLRRDVLLVVVTSDDGGDVFRCQPHRGGEVMVIAKSAICRVHAEPASAGNVGFRPRVE